MKVTQCNVVLLRVKWLENGKAKDIEGYQDEILKIGGPILIPHIHKIFNLAVKQGFSKPWTQSLIIAGKGKLLYLGCLLITTHCAGLHLCYMKGSCYLENYPSFWDFRYTKVTKEFLFLKPNISKK